MYRFSRAMFVEIKDLVDPHPETVSVPEAKRRVTRGLIHQIKHEWLA